MRKSARMWVSLGALLTMALLALALLAGSALAARTVTMLGTWGGQELEAFQGMMAPFEQRTGIKVEFTGTRDLPAVLTTRVQAGNPPDLAALPNPGQMAELAKGGHLVDLSKVLDVNAIKRDYAPVWIDLGSYGGKLYSIFISADLKSLVWYSPKAFQAKGYAIPKTWDEMVALSDRIVRDGGTPWAIGLESGAASGWPGTDWIEDIMLRTAGPEVYDKWVAHQIPWTDPAVKKAWEAFGQIARNARYVYGGITGVLTTNFGDSVSALFTSPPRAYMHRQATFIQSFILQANPGLKPGVDYDFFALPPIDPQYGTPALGAADMVGMFKDTPEARQVMQYLASAEAQERWVAALGKLSANRAVSMNAYPDDLTRKAARILVDAKVFRFDGSDLMPSAVGSGSFWTGILDYVGGEDLGSVLQKIERSAQESYR